MAGARVNNYSPSTADLTSVMGTLDGTRTGYVALSLTNYTSTSRPAIAAGSLVEVAGALFRFSTEEIISTAGVTSTATNTYYIRLVPSSSECTAQFSTSAPVWREDLQGWYQSTASADRYAQFTMQFSAGDYINKSEFAERSIYIGRRSSDNAATYNEMPVLGYMDNGTPLYCRVVSCVTTGAGYASGVHGISLALTNHRIISAVTQSVSSIATHGDPYVFTFCSGTANEEIHAVEFDDTYVRALTFGVCSTGRYYNVTLVYL